MLTVKKLMNGFDACLEWAVFICTGGFVVLCFLQVLCRYVFNNSLPWSEEGSRFLFVFVVFMSGILCVKEQRHTFIDILVNLIPAGPRRHYMVFVYLMMVVFSLILMKAGWAMAVKNMYQVSSALRVPMGYVYMVIPFSGFFMAVHSIFLIIDLYAKKPEEIK